MTKLGSPYYAPRLVSLSAKTLTKRRSEGGEG